MKVLIASVATIALIGGCKARKQSSDVSEAEAPVQEVQVSLLGSRSMAANSMIAAMLLKKYPGVAIQYHDKTLAWQPPPTTESESAPVEWRDTATTKLTYVPLLGTLDLPFKDGGSLVPTDPVTKPTTIAITEVAGSKFDRIEARIEGLDLPMAIEVPRKELEKRPEIEKTYDEPMAHADPKQLRPEPVPLINPHMLMAVLMGEAPSEWDTSSGVAEGSNRDGTYIVNDDHGKAMVDFRFLSYGRMDLFLKTGFGTVVATPQGGQLLPNANTPHGTRNIITSSPTDPCVLAFRLRNRAAIDIPTFPTQSLSQVDTRLSAFTAGDDGREPRRNHVVVLPFRKEYPVSCTPTPDNNGHAGLALSGQKTFGILPGVVQHKAPKKPTYYFVAVKYWTMEGNELAQRNLSDRSGPWVRLSTHFCAMDPAPQYTHTIEDSVTKEPAKLDQYPGEAGTNGNIAVAVREVLDLCGSTGVLKHPENL